MKLEKTTVGPIATFVAFALTLTGVWLFMKRDLDSHIQRDPAITAEQIAIRLESFMARRIAAVDRIRLGWQRGDGYDKATFTADALITHEQYPGSQAINQIDAQGIIRDGREHRDIV